MGAKYKVDFCCECGKKKKIMAFNLCIACYGRDYRRRNYQKRRSYEIKYYEENKRKLRKKFKQYYQDNKEKWIEYYQEYKKINVDKVNEWNRARRARKRSNGGSFTPLEWELLLEGVGNKCMACGISGEKAILQADHIIPVSKGGSSYIWNIQVLCQECNCKKFTKTINYFINLRHQDCY